VNALTTYLKRAAAALVFSSGFAQAELARDGYEVDRPAVLICSLNPCFLIPESYRYAEDTNSEQFLSEQWHSQIQLTEGHEATLAKIANTNSSYISYNQLSSSAIQNDTLQILNATSVNSQLGQNSADTVILDFTDRSSVQLPSEIQLVGKPADLVITAQPGADIICDGCSFEGAGRVILATGELVYNSQSGELSQVQSHTGRIVIGANGMQVNGAAYIDLISPVIRIDGTIDTHMRAQSFGGKPQLTASGDKTVATGKLSLFVGNNLIDIPNGKILASDVTANAQLLTNKRSQLLAGDILISHTSNQNPLSIQGELNTHSDFTLASKYRGANTLANHSVHIESLGDIELETQITAEGAVDISSNKTIHLPSSEAVDAGIESLAIHLVSANGINNHQELTADSVNLAADTINNKGTLWAEKAAYIDAKSAFNNHFGGTVIANKLKIKSAGQITNGSTTAVEITATGRQIDGMPSTSKTLHKDQTALIMTGELSIQAGALLNANPYYAVNEGESVNFFFDPNRAGQVMIYSQGQMNIETGNRVDNRSAIIRSDQGLNINTVKLVNSRTKLETNSKIGGSIPIASCYQSDTCLLNGNQVANSLSTYEYFRYLSPAGRIEAGANSSLQAQSFDNNHSHVSVLGDLDIEVNAFSQEGGKLEQTITTKVTTHHSKKKKKWYGRAKTYRWTTSRESSYTISSNQLPASISVAGRLSGEGADSFSLTTY